MSKTVLGIDEAGRGPVIGPMVVGGVVVEEKQEEELYRMGARDSKVLSPEKREKLDREIRAMAKSIELVIITAKQIDELREIMSLNQVEMRAFAKIINKLKPDKVILDLPENGEKFVIELKSKLDNPGVELVAEHKADANYPVVSAASIVAKVKRDALVREIEKEIGLELGSGYPGDPHTVNFLKKYVKEHETLPDFVRHSWITAERLVGEKKQKSLREF